MDIHFKPIGYLQSCYRDKFGTPRQPGLVSEAWSQLEILPEYQPEESLQGLEGFSHLWLLWLFHQNSSARFHAKVHPPRFGGESMGLFATRTPHRPNPIGLSLVKLERIENSVLYFSGADIVDGTPILDIKPYLPFVESVPDAKIGWVQSAEEKQIQVLWTSEALVKLVMWEKLEPQVNVKLLAEQTLKLDPRPLIYRGQEGQENSEYRSEHACRLGLGDVHFRFLRADLVEIFDIHFLHNELPNL
ncbi:MAG: tRNA (N6-threonylcarbamoyladenosine(37)-N6)-methyltransferase TrmO [Bdellovibrionia bacterium]